MKFGEIKSRLREKFCGGRKTIPLVILGVLGILLIFLSELVPADEQASADESNSADEYDNYKEQTQQELKETLETIDGVGKVTIMLSVEGTAEYVYAEELNTTNNQDGENTDEKYENKIVITGENGVQTPLVKQVLKPKITGAVIVCEGGGDYNIRERVIKAASAALDLPENKICVESRVKN